MLTHTTSAFKFIFIEEINEFQLFIKNLKAKFDILSNNDFNFSTQEKKYYKEKIKSIPNQYQLYTFLNSMLMKDKPELNSYIILLAIRKLLRSGIGNKETNLIYQELPWKKNPYIVTAMIEVMWKENDIEGAWKFLIDAKEEDRLTDEMILEMMRGYAHKDNFDEIDGEKTALLYNLALQLKIRAELYPFIYTNYIEIIRKNKNIKDSTVIQQVYAEACKQGYQYHLSILSQIIISIAHFGNIITARDFFNEIKENLTSQENIRFTGSKEDIYIAMIQAEYLYSKPEESQVMFIYENMPELRKRHYSYLMLFFMLQNNLPFVKKIFNDHFTHLEPPTVACKYMVNALVEDYLALISCDTIKAEEKLNQAKAIYDAHLRQNSTIKYKTNSHTLYAAINLHGESKGSTFTMLRSHLDRALQNKFKNLIFIINCGKGSHSNKNKIIDFHPVRQALDDFLTITNQDHEYTISEKDGTFTVTISLTKRLHITNLPKSSINPWLDTSQLFKSFKIEETQQKNIMEDADVMDIEKEVFYAEEEKEEMLDASSSIEIIEKEELHITNSPEIQNIKQYKTWNIQDLKIDQNNLSMEDWPTLSKALSPKKSVPQKSLAPTSHTDEKEMLQNENKNSNVWNIEDLKFNQSNLPLEDWPTLTTTLSPKKTAHQMSLQPLIHSDEKEMSPKENKAYPAWNIPPTNTDQAMTSNLSATEWPALSFFTPQSPIKKKPRSTLIPQSKNDALPIIIKDTEPTLSTTSPRGSVPISSSLPATTVTTQLINTTTQRTPIADKAMILNPLADEFVPSYLKSNSSSFIANKAMIFNVNAKEFVPGSQPTLNKPKF